MVRIDVTPENGLSKDSCADTFQVRSVSDQRLTRRLGLLRSEDMLRIEEALRIVLRLRS